MKLLLIEDNEADRETYLRLLREENLHPDEVREASTVRAAVRVLERYAPDCVLLDYLLPDGDGLEFLREVSAETGSVPFPVILMTGMISNDVALRAVQAGAQDYLEKARLDGRVLVRILHHAMDRHRMLQDLRDARDQAQQLATHCPLTGLPNRFLFQDRLVRAVAAAGRGAGSLSVVFVDIDRFKTINDSLGHAVGDTVLKAIGQRLATVTRGSDTAARVGGDEFTVLLANMARSEDSGRVVSKILSDLSAPVLVEGTEVHVSASAGIAVLPDDGEDADSLLRNADTAMYRAKEEGGNTYRYYTEDMNRLSVTKLSLERDLRAALESGDLTLRFQPKVDGRNGAVVGAEALTRWTHPKRGPIPPGVFIPLAEETGLIANLGEWALREACRRSVEWRRAGLRIVPVSVNVSVLQLLRGDFAGLVFEALAESGLDGRDLELEVTESCFMRDVDRISELLQSIRNVGVRIALDDFGKGFSSLHRLKRLPLDCLKIDGSFVAGVTRDAGGASIVSAIIALADGLALDVIAEGVERPEELAFLLEHGCHHSQGFLFSPALADTDFREVLRAGQILVNGDA